MEVRPPFFLLCFCLFFYFSHFDSIVKLADCAFFFGHTRVGFASIPFFSQSRQCGNVAMHLALFVGPFLFCFFFLMMASESISVISFRRDVIAQLSRFLRFPRDVLRVYRVAVAFTYLFLVFFYLFHRVIPVLRNGGRMSSFSFHLASELIRTLDRFYRVFFLVTFLSALICFFFQFQATTFTALLMAELSRIAVFFLPFFLRTSYLLLDRLDVSWFLGLSKR